VKFRPMTVGALPYATYSPNGTTNHFERDKAPAGFEEPEPALIVLAEARKPAKRGISGAASV